MLSAVIVIAQDLDNNKTKRLTDAKLQAKLHSR